MWADRRAEADWFAPPDSMVACAIFLGKQDAGGVTGCVASDDEYVVWHG